MGRNEAVVYTRLNLRLPKREDERSLEAPVLPLNFLQKTSVSMLYGAVGGQSM
jgi:hypothetical protein